MKWKWIPVLFLAGCVLWMHCGKKALIRKYYILDAPRELIETDSTDMARLPLNVDVRDFQISKAINQTRMALKSDSHELNYYFYHHWAVRPAAGVADMVYQILSGENCFQKLTRGYSSRPQFLVTGDIGHLERNEMQKKVTAHFAATLELISTDTGLVLVRHSFDRMEPYRDPKNMNAFARTVSRLLFEETQVFMKMIGQYFRENPGELPQ